MKLTAYDLGHKNPADFIPAKPTRRTHARCATSQHVPREERARRQEVAVMALEKMHGNRTALAQKIGRSRHSAGAYATGVSVVPDDVIKRLEAVAAGPYAHRPVSEAEEQAQKLRHIVVGCIDDLGMTKAETARYLMQKGENVNAKWVGRQYYKALRLRGIV